MAKTISLAKNQATGSAGPSVEPGEEGIRDYAVHLYQQSNPAPGHELENWLEATSFLLANIPCRRPASRAHEPVNGPATGGLAPYSRSAGILAP